MPCVLLIKQRSFYIQCIKLKTSHLFLLTLSSSGGTTAGIEFRLYSDQITQPHDFNYLFRIAKYQCISQCAHRCNYSTWVIGVWGELRAGEYSYNTKDHSPMRDGHDLMFSKGQSCHAEEYINGSLVQVIFFAKCVDVLSQFMITSSRMHVRIYC